MLRGVQVAHAKLIFRTMKYSKMYTHSGDEGYTSIASGRIHKSSQLIRLLTRVDMLNAMIGRFYNFCVSSFDREEVKRLQSNMLKTGSVISGYLSSDNIMPALIIELNDDIKKLTNITDELGLKQDDWCYFGYNDDISQLIDEVCCYAREVEQLAWEMHDEAYETVTVSIGTYFNALSKYLYIKARYQEYLSNNK